MKRWSLGLALMLTLFMSGVPLTRLDPVQAAAGPNCSWFYYQEDAQLVYEESIVWAGMIDELAPNGDGVSCPELKSIRDDGIWRDEPPVGAEEGVVIDVVDGDTIDVEYGENREAATIRLVVIDSPELARNGDPAECFGTESSEFASSLIEPGDTVWFTPDERDADRYDRLLRHVWYTDDDGTIKLFEYEMVRNGYAFAEDFGEKSVYLPYVSEAMRVANVGGLGVWGNCSDLTAPAFLVDDISALREGRAEPLPLDGEAAVQEDAAGGGEQAQGENCDPSYPTVCIPPAPPDLDCSDVPYKRFEVLPPDPHGFDRDGDGMACET